MKSSLFQKEVLGIWKGGRQITKAELFFENFKYLRKKSHYFFLSVVLLQRNIVVLPKNVAQLTAQSGTSILEVNTQKNHFSVTHYF